LVEGKGTVMVILDSDHQKDHVLSELLLYSPFVTQGSYLIVEDTNLNGSPVAKDFGPGPGEAVKEFLSGNDQFCADRKREKFLISANPGGYLKRRKKRG
jgi:cephalosporin hydroxylase